MNSVRGIDDATEDDLPMFVIDVLKYDWESLDTMLDLINSESNFGWKVFWPQDFTRDEVERTIRHLLTNDLLTTRKGNHENREREPFEVINPETQDFTDLWFAPNEAGWRAWITWDPPNEE